MPAPPVVYQYGPLDGWPLALPAAPAAPAKEAPLPGKAAARSVVVTTAKGEAPPAAPPASTPPPTPPQVMVEVDDNPVVGYGSINVPEAESGDHAAARFGDHRHGVFGEFLYFRPRGDDVVFAQPRSGCGTASVPNGSSGILAPDNAAGFRGGAVLALDKCSS